MLDKLKKLRTDHLKVQHDLVFYPYQEDISDRILLALIENLRITAGATEADIRNLKQVESAEEISRQGGKTTAVGYTCEFILTFLARMFDRPIRIGIFAPQLDQASLSYDIVRNSLRRSKRLMNISAEEQRMITEQENVRKLVLPDGSSALIAPISKISQIEGLSLDLIIIDEAQDADDEIVQHSIWPMGKTTNAPRIYIGKAGTRICHFYRLSQTDRSHKVYFNDVVAQRRELYEQTSDARHLIYEQSVREDITKYGEESDFIQREYFGKWQIGTGQFITQEALEQLEDQDRKPTFHFKKSDCFAGIDTAKHPDSTVVTILRYNEDRKKKEILNWMELHGDNYQDQFDTICAFLKNYKVVAIAIDSTGQGDFMPDMFEVHTDWADEHSGLFRVKFSAVSKDNIYKNLKVSIQELLTTVPKLDTRLGQKFRQELLDLQQEYKGQLLSVKHPEDANAHDDYPDSWALAEWAYAKWTELNNVSLSVIGGKDKERKVVKNNAGQTEDYWPGLDDPL